MFEGQDQNAIYSHWMAAFSAPLIRLSRAEIRAFKDCPASLLLSRWARFYNLSIRSNLSQEKPYVMVKEDKNLTGNARFEGFCIDLLKWIAGQVGFQYAIKLVPDHMYGVYDPETKEWNGIVRELMEKVRYEIRPISLSATIRDNSIGQETE